MTTICPSEQQQPSLEMNVNGPAIRFKLNSPEHIGPVEEKLCAQMCEKGYSESEIFGVRLAVEESLVNALRHGNQLDPTKHVRVAFEISPDHLWIEIEDEGKGFSVEELPDPLSDDHLNRPHGRGVHLMRAYMCSVEYNDRGNRVLMRKRRSSA